MVLEDKCPRTLGGSTCYAWAAPAMWWIKISAGAQAFSLSAWTPRRLREVEILSQLFTNRTFVRDVRKGFVARYRERSDARPTVSAPTASPERRRDTVPHRSYFRRLSWFVCSPLSAARTSLGAVRAATLYTAIRHRAARHAAVRNIAFWHCVGSFSGFCGALYPFGPSEKTSSTPTTHPIATRYGGRSFVVWPAILYNRSL